MKRAPLRIPSLILLAAMVGACATGPPTGAVRVDARTAHRHLTANVLSTGQPSAPTEQLLRRLGLFDRFKGDAEGVLAELYAGLAPEDHDRLFALSELSYLHGEAKSDRSYLLSAAVLAWAYLFPGDPELRAEPFDPRLRVAAGLYNRGLAGGLASGEGAEGAQKGQVIVEVVENALRRHDVKNTQVFLR